MGERWKVRNMTRSDWGYSQVVRDYPESAKRGKRRLDELLVRLW